MNTFVSDILESETQINSLLNNGRFGSDVSALIENFRGSGAPNNVISRMRDKEIANRNRYNMNKTKRTQDYFKWANEHIQKFLNHLCDGEQVFRFLSGCPVFLNHLCDGERYIACYLMPFAFLNHLCDGELFYRANASTNVFLNHLCDGEQN